MAKVAKVGKDNEKGWILIVMVIFYAIFTTIAIWDMLIVSTRGLYKVNSRFARWQTESKAIGTPSPITEMLSQEMNRRVEQALKEHLTKDGQAKSTNTPYVCQGIISPADPLTAQYSVCDPVTLLNGLPNAENQTLDLLPPIQNQALANTYLRKSVEEQLYNNFSYTINARYIGQELVQAAAPRVGAGLPKPRIDRYRYLVAANVDMKGWYGTETALLINFNVVTTVVTYGNTVSFGGSGNLGCGPPPPPGGGRIRNRFLGLTRCTDPGQPCEFFSGEAIKTDPSICDDGTGRNTCQIDESSCFCFDGIMTCSGTEPSTSVSFTCTDVPRSPTGCVSVGSNSGGAGGSTAAGYTWSTVSRVVGIGHNFD